MITNTRSVEHDLSRACSDFTESCTPWQFLCGVFRIPFEAKKKELWTTTSSEIENIWRDEVAATPEKCLPALVAGCSRMATTSTG